MLVGIGNLVDRVMNGEVVDYINLLFMNFAVFNFADILVCTGIGLLLLGLVLDEVSARRKKQEEAAPSAADLPESTVGHTGQRRQGRSPLDGNSSNFYSHLAVCPFVLILVFSKALSEAGTKTTDNPLSRCKSVYRLEFGFARPFFPSYQKRDLSAMGAV